MQHYVVEGWFLKRDTKELPDGRPSWRLVGRTMNAEGVAVFVTTAPIASVRGSEATTIGDAHYRLGAPAEGTVAMLKELAKAAGKKWSAKSPLAVLGL